MMMAQIGVVVDIEFQEIDIFTLVRVPAAVEEEGVYLLKNFQFAWEGVGGRTQSRKASYRTDIPYQWTRSLARVPREEDYEKGELKNVLEGVCNTDFPLDDDKSVAMSVRRGWTKSVSDYMISFHVFPKNELFERLRTILTDMKLKIQLKISELTELNLVRRIEQLEIKLPNEPGDALVIQFPRRACFAVNNILGSGRNVRGSLTVKVVGRRVPRPKKPVEGFNICRELMNNVGKTSDCVLVAGNGAEVPCHGFILKVHSRVLATMLDLLESEDNIKQEPDSRIPTRRVILVDLSEAGARALVKFMYCWEIEEPRGNFGIAFELLKFGHEFEIKTLEKAMIALITGSHYLDWIFNDVDQIAELIVFAAKVGEHCAGLTQAIVDMVKSQQESLRDELFKTRPEIAMKLFTMACKSQDRQDGV